MRKLIILFLLSFSGCAGFQECYKNWQKPLTDQQKIDRIKSWELSAPNPWF